MNRSNKTILLVVALIISACADDEPPINLPQVETTSLASIMKPYTYNSPAMAISLNDSEISAGIQANVAGMPAQIGDIVETDQELVTLDCSDEQRRLEQAKAQLQSSKAKTKLAKQQYNRAKKLRQQRTVAEETLNLRESEMNAALADSDAQAAAVAIATRNTEKCIIRAPFKAVVTKHHTQIGELLSIGNPVLHIVDLENIEVSANIIAEDTNSLHEADKIEFHFKNSIYPVKLRNITAVIQSPSRTQEARLVFVDKKPPPGANGKLIWHDKQNSLPTNFLSRRNRELGVLITDNQQVIFHPLPNAQEGQPAFVNLDPQTQIITKGRFNVKDGDQVDIIN